MPILDKILKLLTYPINCRKVNSPKQSVFWPIL